MAGYQKRFLEMCAGKLRLSHKNFAALLKIGPRSLSDWKREKNLMSLEAVRLLSKKTKIRPRHQLKIEDKFWYTRVGGSKGGRIIFKKYGRIGGDEEYRKRKWEEWWQKMVHGKKLGKLPLFKSLPFKKPRQSEKLAELIGIIMGDGSINKYQITITLHHKDDLAYSKFVIKLIKRLFRLTPSLYHIPEQSINVIAMSRVNIVRYLNAFGLPIGNKIKQLLDMPQWIKSNKKFRVACLRGLVDTDGSVITHRYKARGKWYSYKKIGFTSFSKPLIASVYAILKELGLHPRISQGHDIRLDRVADVKKYFALVSSHNPKHLKRYRDIR